MDTLYWRLWHWKLNNFNRFSATIVNEELTKERSLDKPFVQHFNGVRLFERIEFHGHHYSIGKEK